MLLKDILTDNAFQVGITGETKEEIIREIGELFEKIYQLDSEIIFKALWNREKKGSTGLGKGLAIPHAQIPNIGSMKLVVLYSDEGKNFDAYDNIPSKLFFSAIIDENGHPQEQLEMLKVIVEMCEKTDIMKALSNIKTKTALKDIIIRRITEIQNG